MRDGMNLEGRWPELFEPLDATQRHAIVQVFAASWHEGWEPNYPDVRDLVELETGVIDDEEYERRTLEKAWRGHAAPASTDQGSD